MTPAYTFRALDHCPMCHQALSERNYTGKRLNKPQGMHPQKVEGIAARIYRCGNCRLTFPNPLPLDPTADRLVITGLTDFWGDRQLRYEHFGKELATLERLSKKSLAELCVLDIGFGLGNSLANMTAHCHEAHGIEPYAIFYEKALEVNGDRLNTALLHCITLEEATFPEHSFDFIFFEALQHLPDLEAGIRKALFWLKPGGIIYAEIPSSGYLISQGINLYYRLRGLDFVVNTSPMHGNYTFYEFSEKSFRENGKLLGYQVVHHEMFPCNPPIGGLPGNILTRIMRVTGTGMQHSIWLQGN